MELKVKITAEMESGIRGKCLPTYFFFSNSCLSSVTIFNYIFYKDSKHCFPTPPPFLI